MINGNVKKVILVCLCYLLAPAAFAGQGLSPVKDKPVAPEFTLPDLDGKIHRLSDYRGKVVILNFWATWCPPCRFEMPSMQTAWLQTKDRGVVILAINVGEDEDTIFTFTGDYPVEFPLLLDKDSKVIRQWSVRGLPTTYIVGPDGRIIYSAIGGRHWDDPKLLEKIMELLPANSPGQPKPGSLQP